MSKRNIVSLTKKLEIIGCPEGGLQEGSEPRGLANVAVFRLICAGPKFDIQKGNAEVHKAVEATLARGE